MGGTPAPSAPPPPRVQRSTPPPPSRWLWLVGVMVRWWTWVSESKERGMKKEIFDEKRKRERERENENMCCVRVGKSACVCVYVCVQERERESKAATMLKENYFPFECSFCSRSEETRRRDFWPTLKPTFGRTWCQWRSWAAVPRLIFGLWRGLNFKTGSRRIFLVKVLVAIFKTSQDWPRPVETLWDQTWLQYWSLKGSKTAL